MLSGVKFIPRDQLSNDLEFPPMERKKSSRKKDKSRRKKKISKDDSSGEEGTEIIKKRSKKKKKWYSSDEYSASSSESEIYSECDEKSKRKEERTSDTTEKSSHKLKKRSKIRKKHYSSYSESSSASESDHRSWKGRAKDKKKERVARKVEGFLSGDSSDSILRDDKELARKELGLDWMLKPASNPTTVPAKTNDQPEEPQVEEVMKPNPRELNPYLKDDGSGYPENIEPTQSGGDRLSRSSVVGDGGASWRLKALKRAQEQAAREGRNLNEVAEERWGSLGQLTVSASSRAAPAHAHLHAIKDRRRGIAGKHDSVADDKVHQSDENSYSGRGGCVKDGSMRHLDMRVPKVQDSLSWRKRKEQIDSKDGTQLISAAALCLNKFNNDGSFMRDVTCHQSKDADGSSHKNLEETKPLKLDFMSSGTNELVGGNPDEPSLSANQLAAKAMQLRMKGKHEEADKLLKQADTAKIMLESGSNTASHGIKGAASRYAAMDISVRQKKKEEDADMHLAQKIIQSKQYSISGRADEEYDFDDGPRRKKNRRSGGPEQSRGPSNIAKHILTQQERCQFCFENPARPKHLVVSIGNFTYLMIPQSPLVSGHCCILPLQHESGTRNVDNNVWGEIRNFKKCLILMFEKQKKKVVFIETVIGLSQQRRHCLVECVPLPEELAMEAPLYFKKAIDEAEDEWSQHNAKKLIDTKEKGLRGSIPKNFPYFYVEFGLDDGFVHVIDDEKDFKSSLGLNVIRGMLQLPEEDMYRRRKHESLEAQKSAVVNFAREWEPYDWTKGLD